MRLACEALNPHSEKKRRIMKTDAATAARFSASGTYSWKSYGAAQARRKGKMMEDEAAAGSSPLTP
jgi:hypothetical protein